jgi:hypothetical protein
MADRERSGTRPTGTAKKTAKKAPAKKAPAKKAPAKKAAVREAPAGQASTRKSSASRIAAAAAQQLLELTGKESEGVVGISKDGESWMVEVEVLELRRIPSTTDVLASYEVTVDTEGELVGYKRLRRYPRGSAREE